MMREMKKLLSILLCLLMAVSMLPAAALAAGQSVAIDETNFPDENFRSYVAENFDSNNDKSLSEAERAAVKVISMPCSNLRSLKGVEFFSELEELDVRGLGEEGSGEETRNMLTELDLSANHALKTLLASDNSLVSVNVTGCSQLDWISLWNQTLTISEDSFVKTEDGYTLSMGSLNYTCKSIPVCFQTTVSVIGMEDTTFTVTVLLDKTLEVNEVNFPDKTFREYVSTEFDLDGDGSLSVTEIQNANRISCPNKGIGSLKGIENFAMLRMLDCSGNELTELDLSANTSIVSVDCSDNHLTKLVIGSNKFFDPDREGTEIRNQTVSVSEDDFVKTAAGYSVAVGGETYTFDAIPAKFTAEIPIAGTEYSLDVSVIVGTVADVSWEVKDGVLTISGTGAMPDYKKVYLEATFSPSDAPWGNLGDLDEEETEVVTEVVIKEGITSIGDYAFCCFTSLKKVTIPDTVKSIGSWAFFRCSALQEITLPAGLTYLGDNAFNWSGITSAAVPGGVSEIKEGTFQRCFSLTGITLSDGLTVIGASAFADDWTIAKINIPTSVKSIGKNAFSGCSGLTAIGIPASVTSIGASAFQYCSELADVYYAGTESQWNAIIIGDNNDALMNATIHYNSQPTVTVGDVNGDGKVSLADVSLIYRFLTGEASGVDQNAADITGDGKVSLRDVAALFKLCQK